jgi:hypothetical protein
LIFYQLHSALQVHFLCLGPYSFFVVLGGAAVEGRDGRRKIFIFFALTALDGDRESWKSNEKRS